MTWWCQEVLVDRKIIYNAFPYTNLDDVWGWEPAQFLSCPGQPGQGDRPGVWSDPCGNQWKLDTWNLRKLGTKNSFLQKYTCFRGQVLGVEVYFTNYFFSVEAQQVIFQHNSRFPEIHHSLMCHVLSTKHRNLPPKPWEADPCGRQSTNGTRNSSPKSKRERERENHLPNSQFFGGVPVFTHG